MASRGSCSTSVVAGTADITAASVSAMVEAFDRLLAAADVEPARADD